MATAAATKKSKHMKITSSQDPQDMVLKKKQHYVYKDKHICAPSICMSFKLIAYNYGGS